MCNDILDSYIRYVRRHKSPKKRGKLDGKGSTVGTFGQSDLIYDIQTIRAHSMDTSEVCSIEGTEEFAKSRHNEPSILIW